jgi:uncharacterized glyoxalase superfamily protein PhnB
MSAPTFYPCLLYRDAPAAIEWLERAFGFEEKMVVPGPDGTIAHAELSYGDGIVMLGSASNASASAAGQAPGPQSIYVAVEDADAHHDRAKAAGAEVFRELVDTDYGSRDYGALDPEGHQWNFGTYRPAP